MVYCLHTGYPHLPTGDSSDRPRPNIDSYSLIIRALCQNGLLKDAVHFYREMAISGLKAGTEICDFLLHYLSDAGLLYDAVELSKYIMKQKLVVSIETQRTFFKSLHAAGDLPNALKIFDSMKWRGCIRQTSSFRELIGV
jgi:pentatricopeptide repeat protein